MENVASFLQYGSGNSAGALKSWVPTTRDLPTPEQIREWEIDKKRQSAKDLALCTISTAEKFMIAGLDVDAAFEKAEKLVEKSKAYLAEKTEVVE